MWNAAVIVHLNYSSYAQPLSTEFKRLAAIRQKKHRVSKNAVEIRVCLHYIITP
jgi:hypothetical protein